MGEIEITYDYNNKYKKTYKTCRIGDKIWLAENLAQEKYGHTLCDDPDCGEACENELFGRLYKYEEISRGRVSIPKGWRLPTVEDFQDMASFIESQGLHSGTALKSINQWHGSAETERMTLDSVHTLQ